MSQEDKHLNAFLLSVEELYKPIVGGRPTETGFDRDFQELKRLSNGLKQSKDHKPLVGQKPENKKKNRYKDITPFDVTRVKLTVTNDDPNSDYINASFIKGAEGHQNYIASQGPLPHTVLDFWQMLWQYNVSVIVMVCREIELGKKKCERYWADQEPKYFGGITVSVSEKHDLSDGYCQRTIKAQKGSEIRYIQQFHYTSWPDHGVPKLCSEIITLINHVRDVQLYSKDETAPLCVHCSAGCGRTGAVLALDYVRNLLETKNVPPGLKMYDIIAEMRRQRPAIVQTKDQYEFVNTAVAEMFRIYMQTRTVTFREFNVGYQGEQYVNVNITGEDKRNCVGPQRPLTDIVSYENVDLRNDPKIHTSSLGKESPRQGLLEGYPDNSPPPKPALRPVSTLLPENTSFGHTLGAFADRKQSVPAVLSQLGGKKPNATAVTTPQTLAPPTPNAKSRGTNLNNVSLLTPASRSRSASGSPMTTEKEGQKEGPKQPPPAGKLKLKPDPVPKNFTNTLPPKSPGNVADISSLHGNTATGLSSPNKAKSNFRLPLTATYGNLDFSTKNEAPQPFIKPSSKNTKTKSPLHEKFARNSTTGGANVPTSKVSARISKPKKIDLKIREDNDAPSDSETDSPALNQKFVLPNTKRQKSPLLPSVGLKPRPAVKPSVLDLSNGTRDFTPNSNADNGEKNLLEGVLKNAPRPKPQPMRPWSQNLTNPGLPNSKKTGISTSVFNLSSESNKMVPPSVPQKTAILWSSSVSGVNLEEGKGTSVQAMRAKFQVVKTENGESNSKGDSKDVQVTVIGYTQADGSYGPIFAATAKSFSSDGRASTLQRKASNYQIQTSIPFKPQSRHSISKLNTSRFPGPSKKQISSSSPKKTLPHSYENTDIRPNKKHKQLSAPANQNSTSVVTVTNLTNATQDYVNTSCDSVDISSNYDESPVNLLSSSSKSNYSTHPGVEEELPYVNAPTLTPPQSSTHKIDNLYSRPGNGSADAQQVHGFVACTPDEGVAKLTVTAKPKAVEEMKKKAPIKPKRSIRIKSTKGTAVPSLPSTIASNSSPSSAFQKYQKTNLYSDIVINENDENPKLIVEAEHEGFPDRNIIPRSNSAASLDKSSPSSRASTPPKLPARTVESQMLLNEPPPELPTRTEESYMTLDDTDEQQPYEAIEMSTTVLASPSPVSSHAAEKARRPSAANSIAGTRGFAAKAKNMVEKTTNKLSKVGTSISKSNDEDSSGLSTIQNRTPTYTPGPVMYAGQDLSFGKRFMRKVKGGRKPM